MASSVPDRVRGALWGMFIGDSIAMPVHWYYDRSRLRADFGTITKYEAPKSSFPGSIMNLSNTGGGGRGSDSGSIIGDVICHGKKKFWTAGGSYHYHHGMAAGENTLDTILCRLLVDSLVKVRKGDDGDKGIVDVNRLVDRYLEDYVAFMTTPDTHNDTYAATAHRMFFANWVKKGRPTEGPELREMADNDGHNTDSVDGLINVLPLSAESALAADASPDSPWEDPARRSRVSDVINALRESTELPKFGYVYDELLQRLFRGEDLRETVLSVAKKVDAGLPDQIKQMSERSGQDPMSACYVRSNFPVTLLMAYKYADSPERAVLASANAGGENVNRNALLGAIMGAGHGMAGWPGWMVEGLVAKDKIKKSVDDFVGH